MSSNGIQLTTGEGKYVHGRGGWRCNGAVCVHVPGLTQDIDHLLLNMVSICGVSSPEYTICAKSDLCLNENNAKILQTRFSQMPICGSEQDVWREAK